jgi:hypothetical protein
MTDCFRDLSIKHSSNDGVTGYFLLSQTKGNKRYLIYIYLFCLKLENTLSPRHKIESSIHIYRRQL